MVANIEHPSERPELLAAGPGPFSVAIEHDFAQLEDLRESWDEAVERLNGSIHMTYDWSRTWWQFYGGGKELRIFVCRAGGKIVAIVPTYIDRIGIKPLQLSVARLICASIPPKAFNPAIDPAWIQNVFAAIWKQLCERDRCDLISLGPVSETSGVLKKFEDAARDHSGACISVSRRPHGVHTVFELPPSMDQFFEGIDKDERKKRKYEMRLLAKEPGITRDVVTNPEAVAAEFEAFAVLHAGQWRGKGKLGHFGSWPAGKEYNLSLGKALARLDRVRFVRILSGAEVISNQFGFVFGDTFYWELPARAVDKKWNRFSLGTTGFFGLVEQAIKEGCMRIEAGVAHYDYKRKLNGAEHSLEILRLISSRAGSKFRVRFFGWVRGLLELAYSRIWYSRIMPRMPAVFRKPLWPFWLRLDF